MVESAPDAVRRERSREAELILRAVYGFKVEYGFGKGLEAFGSTCGTGKQFKMDFLCQITSLVNNYCLTYFLKIFFEFLVFGYKQNKFF